jgi:hypothetical protein
MHQFKVHKYLGVFPTVYFLQLEVEGDFIVISDFGGVLWLVNSQAVGVVGGPAVRAKWPFLPFLFCLRLMGVMGGKSGMYIWLPN